MNCNPNFEKGSELEKQILSPLLPEEVCLETIVLDTLCYFDQNIASEQEIVAMMKYNPFVVEDVRDEMLLSVCRGSE